MFQRQFILVNCTFQFCKLGESTNSITGLIHQRGPNAVSAVIRNELSKLPRLSRPYYITQVRYALLNFLKNYLTYKFSLCPVIHYRNIPLFINIMSK